MAWCSKCQLHCDFSRKVPLLNTSTFDKDTIRNELKNSNVTIAEPQDINWFLDVSNCDTKTSNKISKGACNFLKRLSGMHSKINMIITYGDNASNFKFIPMRDYTFE